jgi:hypothetical protein
MRIVHPVSRERRASSTGPASWQAFGVWVAAGSVWMLVFVSGFSIGIFVLLVAVGVTIAAARSVGAGAVLLGVITGVGLVCIVIPLFHLGAHEHCPEMTIAGPGKSSSSCEEFDTRPWIGVGVTFGLAGLAMFGFVRRR